MMSLLLFRGKLDATLGSVTVDFRRAEIVPRFCSDRTSSGGPKMFAGIEYSYAT